jgi:hypothetical protein
MKLFNLLLESFQMFKVQLILKMDSDANAVEIYNQLRALRGIVVLTLLPSDVLHAKSQGRFHYTLVRIKFIGLGSATEALEQVRAIALNPGDIEGLRNIIVRNNTIKKIRNY